MNDESGAYSAVHHSYFIVLQIETPTSVQGRDVGSQFAVPPCFLAGTCEALAPTSAQQPVSVAQVTAGCRIGLHRGGRLVIGELVNWSSRIRPPIYQSTSLPIPFSPISSGGNFGGLRLGRACSDPAGPPGVSGSFSLRTWLRHSRWQGCSIVARLYCTPICLSIRLRPAMRLSVDLRRARCYNRSGCV